MKKNMFKKTISTLAILFLFACLSFMGCSSIKHATAKDSYITKQMQSYAFSSDVNNVMAQAKSLLFSSGYAVHSTPNPYSLETQWAFIDQYTQRQYLVTAASTPNGTTIRFDYREETHKEGFKPYSNTGRDYVMEYELLKRMEHDKWSSIEQAAEAYANAHD